MKIVFYFLFVLEVFILFFMIGLLIVALKNYREIKELKQKYIIANKVKCMALCKACQHSHYCDDWSNDCRECEQYGGEYHCKCSDVENGKECPYFKPIESEA